MKLGKMSILTGMAAVFFLSGYSERALGFQDMTCSPGPSAGVGIKTCRTIGADAEGVKISCGTGSSAENAFPVYTCFAVVRDWGQPSPYAHTSQTWRCRAGAVETFLFASDFFQDTVRCDIVCGRCKTGWAAAPLP